MTEEVRIPDIGDIDQVEVIEICVAPGDQVGPDDALIVIESDKASMEVPAGVSGTIAEVAVVVGDQVGEGALVVTLTSADEGASKSTTPVHSEAEPGVEEEADSESRSEAAPKQAEASSVPGGGPLVVEIRVPDIGEAANVVVIEVAVQPGMEVEADDLLVVVESDKASMEIPAGQAGTVGSVHVEVGAEVEEGTLLATLSTESGGQRERPAPDGVTPVEIAQTDRPDVVETAAPESHSRTAQSPLPEGRRVYASPAVRRLARELGVQLQDVKGSGNRGRILKNDVKHFVKSAMTEPSGGGPGIPTIPAVDFARFGPVESLPLSRIRAAGAANLHRSWLNLPHVTQFEEADVTELEAFRKTLKDEAQRRDVKITPLPFIVKACCYALEAFPTFNASLDPEQKNFLLKKYYHIGFAVDTEEGLVVPVIRDADKLGIWDLSTAIAELAEKARTKSLGMADLQGGSFSISSLGGIGGTGFTPIINAPEVAILGVSKLTIRPVWNGSEFEPRQMLPLSLSYDHRAINGAEAGRFMVLLAELLGDIRRLAL